MAATAKMSHQNGKKYGHMGQECFTDGMVDHEMHLKMSKKIAQLTKVIYALNTKNDEHEHIVKTLTQQHEREKLQLTTETRAKVETFRSKIALEGELRKRIDSLEQSICEHEKQKKMLIQSFENLQRDTTVHENDLKAEYSQKVSSMAKDLTNSQRNFEQQLEKFSSLIKAFEKEKEQALGDMRKAHAIEVENLMKTQRNQSGDLSEQLSLLRTKYDTEIEQLKTHNSELLSEKDKLEEDFNEKLEKSRSLFEKELEVLRSSQNNTLSEQQKTLQDKLDKITKDFQFQEVQYRRRVDGLLGDLSIAEETISQLKHDIEVIKTSHESNASDLTNLQSQLEAAKRDASAAQSALRNAEQERQVLGERCSEQADELVKKAGLLGELQAVKTQQEETIYQLQDEMSEVKSRLKLLQDEKNSLQSKTADQAKEKSREVQALERALEDLRIEKHAQRDKYVLDIASLEQRLSEESSAATLTLKEQLEALRSQHNETIRQLKDEELLTRDQLEQRLKLQLNQEVEKLETANKELKQTLEAEITELTSKLQAAEQEIERLTKHIGDTKLGLGEATSELSSLQDQASTLRQQLDKATAELNSSKSLTSNLQVEIQKLKETNSELITRHEVELKQKLADLTHSLEESWMNKLRSECQQLKSDLERQFASDKSAAMKHLAESRDSEVDRITKESQQKVNQLLIKVEHLESDLNRARQDKEQHSVDIQNQYSKHIEELTEQLESLKQQYEKRLIELEQNINSEWKEKLSGQEKDHQNSTMQMKTKHLDDMQSQIAAHKSAVDMIRQEADKSKKEDLERQSNIFGEEKAQLRNDLSSKYQQEMEMNHQGFMKQLTASRMELQRAVELKNQKEIELSQTTEEMTERIVQRDRNIQNLENDIHKLERSIDNLSREIEMKGEEILNVKSDANKQLRRKEESLMKSHAEQMERLKALHAEETQQVLTEFSKAQDLLKEKISELSEMLEEAEERYRNRDPREEDLAMIDQLRAAILAREQEMQQLIADKQYYQMELVNRETNFTKVFAGSKTGSAQPQVGFINPLAKKKKGEKGPTKYAVNMHDNMLVNNSSSANSQSSRLRPIAGSPIHDEKLNPNHVLPPPQAFTKKFVQ